MRWLARRSVRGRLTAFVATFVAVFSSALLFSPFAQLLEAAIGPMPMAERESLVIMGGVIGTWAMILGVFAPVSTLALVVHQRTAEFRRLRTLGATSDQLVTLVRTEALAVGVPAAILGALSGWPLGRGLFATLQNAGIIGAEVPHANGLPAAAIAALIVIWLVRFSAGFAARGAIAGRTPAGGVLAGARPTKVRMIVIGVLLWHALGAAGITLAVTAHDPDPYAAMQSSGPAAMIAALAAALAASWVTQRFGPRLQQRLGSDVVGELALYDVLRRPQLLAPLLGPLMVMVAGSTSVAMVVLIDAFTVELPPTMTRAQANSLLLLNGTVAVVVTIFTALMAVNAALAALADRRGELEQLHRIGATRTQVRRVVRAELSAVWFVGTAVGLGCSLLTVIPFAVARESIVVPLTGLWIPVVVALLAAVLLRSAGALAQRL
ncbi:MAG: ABC transporter permease [Tetrasphaera sp.]